MKAERRHELQQNSLARAFRELPEHWRKHGSKLTLALIVVLLAIVLLRLYSNNKATQADLISTQLTTARSLVTQLGEPGVILIRSPAEKKSRIDAIQGRVEEAVTSVLNNSADPSRQAEAKLIRADLRWQLASMGEPVEAATQPALQMKQTPAELLQGAAQDYKDVLDHQDSLPHTLVNPARFGLATIAEDRGEWAQARGFYEAVTKDADAGKALKDLAKVRLTSLDTLSKPVVLGQPMDLATRPATAPIDLSLTLPTTQPMTLPTTLIVVPPLSQPTTAPASGPATLPVSGATTAP